MSRKFVWVIIMIMIFNVLSACGTDLKQTLSVKDITLYVGTSADIEAVWGFSDNAEDLTFHFDSKNIAIDNGHVTALKKGKAVVTAKSKSCETTFKVNCQPSFGDVTAFVGYPQSEFCTELTTVRLNSLEFIYDSEIISIQDNTVTALKEGSTLVTAKEGAAEHSFNVDCYMVDKTHGSYFLTDEWKNMVRSLRSTWESYGTSDSTVFIGDSFFDTYFFSNFYEIYGNDDALCLGIGGTTSFSWEMFADTLLKDANPANMVMNIGNNNVYNNAEEAEETIINIKRCMVLLHGRFPQTEFYLFSIVPRTFDFMASQYKRTIAKINTAMQEWCGLQSWIKFLDVSDRFPADKLSDNIHPKVEEYQTFVDALNNSGIVISPKK